MALRIKDTNLNKCKASLLKRKIFCAVTDQPE